METPKTVRKGLKQKAETVNNYFRICKCSFKVQFGNSKCSTDNLFKESSTILETVMLSRKT